MDRKWLLYRAGLARLLILTLSGFFMGCSVSGMVTDRSKFGTSLNKMKLEEYPALKVYHGGAVREIPLKDISSISLDPSKTIINDNELFYRAEISLKGSNEVRSSGKDESQIFVSIQNVLCGKKGKDKFSISLDNVSLIEIKK